MSDKSKQHLSAMMMRTNLSQFDRSAIRDVLDDIVSAGERVAGLVSECRRLSGLARSEFACVACGGPAFVADETPAGSICSRCCPTRADDILKAVTEILDTGEEIRPFTDLHYRALAHLNPIHEFITTLDAQPGRCVICGAAEAAHA